MPPGWTITDLQTAATWGSGGTPKVGTGSYYGGPIPWAVIGDLTDGPVHATHSSITELGLTNSSAKIVDAECVLIAMYGSIGKLGLPTIPMATNQAIAFARPKHGLLVRKYLFYYLMSQRPILSSAGKGATQQNISQTILRSWPLPLPPLAEQERIVAAIEERFSRLDAGVAAMQRARQNLRRMRAASFNEAAAHSPIAGSLQNTDGKWPVQPLGEVVDGPSGIVDGPFGSNLKSVHYTQSGPRVLRLQNIGDGEFVEAEAHISHSHFEALRRHEVRSGDLVCAILGDVLPRAIVVPPDLGPAIVKADCPRIRLAEHMNPRFVWAVLNAPSTRRTVSLLIRGVGRPRLTVRALRQIPIPVPPRDVQDAVVERLDCLLNAGVALERAVSRVHTRQAAARSSILAAAFSGQLVPQDSADEPASVLLERIAGEGAASNGHNGGRAPKALRKASA